MDRFRSATRQVGTWGLKLVGRPRRTELLLSLLETTTQPETKEAWRDAIMSSGEGWSARPPTRTNKDGYRVVGHNFLWLGVSKCLPPIQVLQLLTTKSYLILCGVPTGKAAAAPGDGLPPCSFAYTKCDIIPCPNTCACISGLRRKVALPTVACRMPVCSASDEVY